MSDTQDGHTQRKYFTFECVCQAAPGLWHQYGLPFEFNPPFSKTLSEILGEKLRMPIVRVDLRVAHHPAAPDKRYKQLVIHRPAPTPPTVVDITSCESRDECIALCVVHLRLSGGAA